MNGKDIALIVTGIIFVMIIINAVTSKPQPNDLYNLSSIQYGGETTTPPVTTTVTTVPPTTTPAPAQNNTKNILISICIVVSIILVIGFIIYSMIQSSKRLKLAGAAAAKGDFGAAAALGTAGMGYNPQPYRGSLVSLF